MRVLIVGAGLGGLALAQILKKQEVDFDIFDRDESEFSRRQGLAIGINKVADELQDAVRDSMPSIYTTNHLLPLDLPAQIIFTGSLCPGRFGVKSDTEHPVLRASRSRLRTWLTRDVDIQYGKMAVRIEQTEDSVTVHFKDGTSATGDILVGADGTHSCVRKALTDIKPDSILLAQTMAEITLEGDAVKRQLELGHSAYIVDDAGNDGRRFRLFVGLDLISDSNTAKYYWLYQQPVDSTEDEDYIWSQSTDPNELLVNVRRKLKNVDPRLREIVELTSNQDVRTPAIKFYCLELKGLPNSRATLLGDAAHVMPPFRGEGGVHAVRDAINLGKILGSLKDSSDKQQLLQALDEYQKEMLERGSKAAVLSRDAFTATMEGPPSYAWEIRATAQPEVEVEFPLPAN